jgi:hypothetical protein
MRSSSDLVWVMGSSIKNKTKINRNKDGIYNGGKPIPDFEQKTFSRNVHL